MPGDFDKCRLGVLRLLTWLRNEALDHKLFEGKLFSIETFSKEAMETILYHNSLVFLFAMHVGLNGLNVRPVKYFSPSLGKIHADDKL